AAELRRHLSQIEGIRTVLFQRTSKRAPLRAHDLRATFVTLALASGKTETWDCDRTGHRSSSMPNKYRRAARTAAELGLGWLKPMHEVIRPAAQKLIHPGRVGICSLHQGVLRSFLFKDVSSNVGKSGELGCLRTPRRDERGANGSAGGGK